MTLEHGSTCTSKLNNTVLVLNKVQNIYISSQKVGGSNPDGVIGIYIYIYQARRLRVRIPMVSLEFFIDIIFPVALWPSG